MSTLDWHVKSKKHKSTVDILVPATPISIHVARMIKSQFHHFWGELLVFGDVEWQNSLYGHSREISTHGKKLNVLINTAQYFSQIFVAAVNLISHYIMAFYLSVGININAFKSFWYTSYLLAWIINCESAVFQRYCKEFECVFDHVAIPLLRLGGDVYFCHAWVWLSGKMFWTM